ncbi:MAG: hypothetical protein JWO58_1845, partial [Chitinophagaceae bacterium]|nr:hypothetical protein [Chitinophagaceae bacterium]
MKSLKDLLVVISLFFVFMPAQAQLSNNTGEYTVEWDNKPLVAGAAPSQIKERLSFKGGDYDQNNSPVYSLYIYGKSLRNAVVIPTETTPLTDKDRFVIPTTIDSTRTQVVFHKGVPITVVHFIPLIINNTGISKIVKFKVEASEAPYSIPSRSSNTSARVSSATTSALASGKWVKFPITQDGIYKIDYGFLQANGFNPSSLNPTEIQLYGNGGGMLSQLNSDPRAVDLEENAIQVIGGADGTFDEGDYILFYAKGPHTWSFNTSTSLFEHTYNLYSEEAYYFLTAQGSTGARVQTRASLGSATQSFDYFDDHQFYELDQYNILKSGRSWLGDLFNVNTTLSLTRSFDWQGGRAGAPIDLSIAVLGRSNNGTSFSVKFNQTTLSSFSVPALPIGSTYPAVGSPITKTYPTFYPSAAFNGVNISLTFNNGGNFTSQANLDYIRIQGQRDLQLNNSQTGFRVKASSAQPTSEYQIKNASTSLVIWDVTIPSAPVEISYAFDPLTNIATFSDQSDVVREYVCFNGSGFYSPGAGIAVANQNIHGITSGNLPDMVIVTHASLLNEAKTLANHRHSHDNMDVLVVTTEEVYNEFSSGAQDITAIRDLMKMLYDRNTASDSVRFLLLFGSCSYDYKSRVPNNKNLVPCYESRNSIEPLRSYSSEDYYGFMDNNEGYWDETSSGNAAMEISIGRIPARNPDEAAIMVNKIIHYQTSTNTEAKWKNRITFVCDDGDSNLHLEDAEHMADVVASEDKRYNENKIYLDAYPQESTAGGEKSPIVKDLIDKDIAKGVFIMNYSGHGGTGAWAQELILELAQAEAWTNIDAMPLMVTATCDFGLYDDPAIRSGTDAVLFNANGGSIGIVTSTRVVYQYSNRRLNEQLYEDIFIPYGTDVLPRMGDVWKLTKNNSFQGLDINNRNYAFLGDPSMKLAYPQEKMVITQINGHNVSTTADTIKALSKVTIVGEVRNGSNTVISGYNGTATITCFDKQNIITTLGNQSAPYTFNLLNNVFFEGKASITNGTFTVTFIVPKDISYLYDQGKISLYGMNASSLDDAGGYYDNVQIGGSNTSAPADTKPPVAILHMNDDSFVSGGLTNNNPLFIAKVSDENGINVGSSGIGHEITITMSNNPNVVILNEYYTTTVDSYTSGTVRYPLKDLPAGNYSLQFKVWDTYNNSTTSYLEFVVANTDKMAIDHVLNYPNPFSTHTEFHFDQNRPGDDLEILIQVYTVSGKMIKSFDVYENASSIHISGITWDGRDEYGDKIGKGVYVYKVKVRSIRDGSTT